MENITIVGTLKENATFTNASGDTINFKKVEIYVEHPDWAEPLVLVPRKDCKKIVQGIIPDGLSGEGA